MNEEIADNHGVANATESATPAIPPAGRQTNLRILTETSLLTALAGVLNFFPIYYLPQGGAITLGGMIPILFLALRRGVKVGLAGGAILGLIVLYVPPGPIIVHPVQFLLDYPIAFGALGLAGFFRGQPPIGVGVGILGRFVAHFVSGIVFFAAFAPPELGAIVYSAVYNGSYLLPEFVISTIIIFILVKRNLHQVYL